MFVYSNIMFVYSNILYIFVNRKQLILMPACTKIGLFLYLKIYTFSALLYLHFMLLLSFIIQNFNYLFRLIS